MTAVTSKLESEGRFFFVNLHVFDCRLFENPYGTQSLDDKVDNPFFIQNRNMLSSNETFISAFSYNNH